MSRRPRLKTCLLIAFLTFFIALGSVTADTLEDSIRARNFHEAMSRIQKQLPEATEEERQRLLLLLADCQVQLNQLQEAQETLAHLDPRTSPARFFRIRGQYQNHKGEESLADRDFRQALKLSGSVEDKIDALCELTLLHAGTDKSERLWSQALEEASTANIPPQSWTNIYRTRYEILIQTGQTQAALDFCRLMRRGLEKLSDKRGLVWAYLAEIDSLKRLNRFEDAENVWHRALAAAGEHSAPVLLMWGYPTLYDRDDPPALRRVLSEVEKHWSSSDKWSDYERYHVRMMQAQIWLHGFNDARQGLRYLQLAEPLASTEPRPAGERMSVQMNFHKFGEGQSSDIEQVLWLQLRCFRELQYDSSEITAFMKSKLDLLPAGERPAWLFTLGKRTLPEEPDLAADYFVRSLEDSSGFTRGLLLSEMMDTFYQYGLVAHGREKESQLQSWLSERSKMSERFEVFRYVVPQSLDREWSQNLWSGVWSPQGSFDDRRIFLRLFGDRLDEMEKELSRVIKESEASANHFETPGNLCLKAQLLVLQGRYAEALAVCEKGQSLDRDTKNFYHQFERLASYAHQRLGENKVALERVRRAREQYAKSGRYGAEDFELDCALLEVGYLLDAGRLEEAIDLCTDYKPRSEGQDKRALAMALSRAHLQSERYQPAWDELAELETEVPHSIFAAAVMSQRAAILHAQGRHDESRESLKSALALARSLESERQRDVISMWREIDPETSPTQVPEAQAMSDVPETDGWLTRTDFLRLSGDIMLAHPEFSTTVELLPRSLVSQAARLESDAALVEYFMGERELVILLSSSDGYAIRRLAVDRDTLQQWMGKVRTDEESARQLGRVLVEPLEPICAGRRLTLVGHGSLLSLPWDLLQLKKGPMVQLYEWRLWAGPSISESALNSKGPHRVLALGGVSGLRLPGSEREVKAIKDSGFGSVDALTGPAANTENLKRLLPEADVLHLATHSTPTEIQLSDRMLPLNEVYALPLRTGSLVVLSSCEGADPGEQQRGPVTLAAAFLAAGASEVIAGTDRVGDEETEALFIEFYQALGEGLSPSSALRWAKLKRREANPDGDWSKFVLMGG